ncbi:latent-transforming growth factor beta-binding protein 4 [Exaiptasia diaphana]|uniref:Uncharacterized protein n=1 Tax=Exaiptasia diaphana TaxID=2652724 RepID=A0A913XP87_EXADI|nr:latent-transforming growth factor beta-binding protein 4 [Exaiptasia diaphana]
MSMDYIARRGRNSYVVYERAIFKRQTGETTHAIPRGMRRPLPYPRRNIIIDLPPLKSKVKPGDNVLAELGQNYFASEIYSDVKIVRIKNDKYYVKPVCDMQSPPVGIYDDYVHFRVSDSSFKASSVHPGHNYAARYGRLYKDNDGYAWCPNYHDFNVPWLSIDLEEYYFICSVKTSGLNRDKYTLTYTMSVSTDSRTWEDVKENGQKKVFKRHASPDVHHQYIGMIDKPYRYVKFFPTSFKTWPCLNVEIHGHGEIQTSGPFPMSFPLKALRLKGSVCNLQTKCLNTPNGECSSEGYVPGTYTCRCKSGFQGPQQFDPGNKANCIDINECLKDPCGKHTVSCTNNPGSYRCNCKTGYKNENKDLTKCRDVDECIEQTPCSPNARCSNTDGSYTCECNTGYYGDGFTCTDIDECNPIDGVGGCQSHYADCVNTPGSYTCTCWKGYTGDGDICTDVNECALDQDPCESINGKCINNVGSYFCQCNAGFTLVEGKCQDVDECKSPDLNDCNQLASCENIPGSYSCECKSGFTGKGYDAFGCSDIDECKDKNICGSNSKCSNTKGSFHCTCEQGFASVNNKNCVDIDECKNTSACNFHATCQNLLGSYKCTCSDGFTGDGQPIPNGCSALAWCEWKGKAICDQEFRKCDNSLKKCTECLPGFKDVDSTCKDIDECSGTPCGEGGACTNSPGSYTCKCKKGFHFDKKHKLCKDINECSRSKRVCHDDAVCKNSPGSFDCNCKQGFDGDGFYCADINECYTGAYKCPAHSVCYNLLGSYKCVCKKGYHTTGSKCHKGGAVDTNAKKTEPGKLASVYSKVAFWNGSSHGFTPNIFTFATMFAVLVVFREQL